NQVQVDITGQLPQLEMQFRPDVAKPRDLLAQASVRQALFQAIDRGTLAEVMTHSLAPLADSWYPPTHPLRADVDSAIPKYPFDPRAASALLGDAGWNRAADGMLVNGSGERFNLQLWGLTGQTFAIERQLSIIADGWRSLGVAVDFQA